MTDDKKKNIQKMNEEDLNSVSGGISVYKRQGPNTGRYTPVDRTVFSDSIEGNGTAAADNSQNGGSIGTSMADCPRCQAKTLHMLFTGGRGKCTVCGLTRDRI